MADKRISQLIERVNIANNDVLPIVASGATTTNKVTISTIQDWMQSNLDVGVTSVGLTMPSAFQVSGSPITTSGNITVTATGTASQYIRGDGTLADFPQGGGGGGASVSYYLNGSVSQGTIGGVTYLEMNKTPILGAGTDFNISADGYIASFITDAGDPSLLEIPAGNWNFETYFQASSGGGTPSFYIELYKVSGATATLIASNSGNPELIAFGTSTTPYFSALAVPQTTLALTDRLAIRIYVVASGRTITLHTENSNLCQVITTFTTGLTALNGLTAQVQNFATGTSGTDFNISSTGSIHTFNLPDASASNRGAITTGSQVFGGVKTFANGLSLSAVGGSNQVTRLVNIGTLHEGSATLNQIGFNSGNNIYFGKGLNNGGVISWNNAAVRYYTLPDADGTLALTSQIPANPVGGTGTTNQIPKFSATSTLTNSNISDNGTEVNIQSRVFVTSGGQQFVFTPNLATTSNRIETTGSLPLEIVSGGNIRFAAGGTTPQITLTSGGNVGIGTASPDRKLSLSVSPSATGDDGISISNGSTSFILTRTGSSYSYRGVPANAGMIYNGTNIALLADGANISFHNGNGESMRITSGGSVQIGTSSGSGARTFIYDNRSNSTALDEAALYIRQDGSNAIQTWASGGATERMRITSSGNVGIGTASPVGKFEIASAANTYLGAPAITFTDTAGSGNSNRWIIGNIATDFGSFNIASAPTPSSTTFTPRLTITSTGNVGIGTASPSDFATLTLVKSGTTNYSGVNVNNPNSTANLFVGVGGSSVSNTALRNNAYVLNAAASDLILGTSDTERMRITSGGNVGINVTSPSYKLQVDGNVYFKGASSGSSDFAFVVQNSSSTNNLLVRNDGVIFAQGIYNLTTGSAANVVVFSDGSMARSTSSIKYKTNVQDYTKGLQQVMQLRPVTYEGISETDEGKTFAGLIAEEVHDLGLTEFVQYAEDGSPDSLAYQNMIALAFKAIQEQQEQIKSLTEQVEALKSQING